MEIGTTVLFVSGLAVIGLLAAAWSVVRQVLGLRLQRMRIEINSCSLVPPYVTELFREGDRDLSNLGFLPSHCENHEDPLAHEFSKRWAIIYVHSGVKSYAKLSMTWDPNHMPGYEIDFSSDFADGSCLLTLNGRAHKYPHEPPSVVLVDPYTEDLDSHWEAHRSAVHELSKDRDLVLLSPEEYAGKDSACGSSTSTSSLPTAG
jgi:hypothetical protein